MLSVCISCTSYYTAVQREGEQTHTEYDGSVQITLSWLQYYYNILCKYVCINLMVHVGVLTLHQSCDPTGQHFCNNGSW